MAGSPEGAAPVHGPGGWTTSAIVNRETAVLRDPAAKLSRPAYCLCERSPFCRGAASQDWATCDSGCRACRLPTPRPVVGPDPSLADG